MSYVEFKKWSKDVNKLEKYGAILEVILCIQVIEYLDRIPKKIREDVWKKDFETRIIEEVVTPIENRAKEDLEETEND